MFLDTSGGILMYFYHAEIKILNEWLYTPQEGFIPLEVCTAALLSYPPSCTVYNPNSLQVLTKRPIYNFHLIDDHVWYNNTLQGIALVGASKIEIMKQYDFLVKLSLFESGVCLVESVGQSLKSAIIIMPAVQSQKLLKFQACIDLGKGSKTPVTEIFR